MAMKSKSFNARKWALEVSRREYEEEGFTVLSRSDELLHKEGKGSGLATLNLRLGFGAEVMCFIGCIWRNDGGTWTLLYKHSDCDTCLEDD